MKIKKLKPEELRRECKAELIPDEIEVVKNFGLGQERAEEALRLALEIQEDIFNPWVVGDSEIGKTALVKGILNEIAPSQPLAMDLCFVNNFTNDYRPNPIFFPAGGARVFKKEVRNLTRELMSMNIEARMWERARSKRDELLKVFNNQIEKDGFRIEIKPYKGTIIPIVYYEEDGKEWTDALVESGQAMMPDEERNRLKEIFDEFKKSKGCTSFFEMVEKVRKKVETKLEEMGEEGMKELKKEKIKKEFAELLEKYSENDAALDFLASMEEDVKDNMGWFDCMGSEQIFAAGKCQGCAAAGVEKCPMHGPKGVFVRYEVSVLVDNSQTKGAPVIFKQVNSFNDIFGSVDTEISMGGHQAPVYSSNHTHINAGALIQANGGYLVLKVNDMLAQPYIVPVLKKLADTLKSGEMEIESLPSMLGLGGNIVPLRPEPVPLKVRVVLIGSEAQRQALLQKYADELINLSRVFKIKVQMELDMPFTKANVEKLYGFVKGYCEKEGLPVFDKEALARVDEFSSEIADSQEKISLKTNRIKMLLKEAAHYTKKDGRKEVALKDIELALSAKRRRHSLFSEKMQEYILAEKFKISTEGGKVGTINALAVYTDGEYSFGRPGRVTAVDFSGGEGIVSVDREAKMSGKTHTKGSLILENCFKNIFENDDFVLVFGASISFEQSYGGIDGDSASSTELYALLSAFSDMPIDQGIAVTGSVNQCGDVQVIGGVNLKIQGFFDICKERGLNGKQGVMIPEDNVKNLMLDKEVVEAVRLEKFHIWPISRIEQGIEILTGMPFGGKDFEGECIYKKVYEHLKKMSAKAQKKGTGGTSKKTCSCD
ncbi:AAA family ATPase [Patescibacteria group bacterium]|nr:AAA family ATPase [Patescibacteria group bacterium]